MSAAFDLVDHDLRIQKLAFFGFDSDSVAWVRSYLELRSQSVMIEGCLSKLFKVNSGMPPRIHSEPIVLYSLYK